jgi:2-amino-4-hydroxy-6-hydroxymethyldihydropteridine diphosphokinase
MVVGLGSNLGERRETLLAAFAELAAIDQTQVVARSSLWQTSPVGGPPQDDFYNAAVLLRTSVAPETFLGALLAIERRFGRLRHGRERNMPRTLDLDLLWIEGVVVSLPALQVPHPRLHQRAFALAPLLEVAPDAADPRTGTAYSAILTGLEQGGIRRLPWNEPPR